MEWIKCRDRLPEDQHNYHVKILSNGVATDNPYLYNAACYFDGEKFENNEVREWLDEQSSPWLPVDGGVLPEDSKEDDNKAYLTMPNYRVLPFYDNHFWGYSDRHDDFVIIKDVTHWMPLPQPPATGKRCQYRFKKMGL